MVTDFLSCAAYGFFRAELKSYSLRMVYLQVKLGFGLRRLSSGNDSDDLVRATIAMHHNQQTECLTQAQEHKAILVLGMIGVINQLGVFVCEYGLRLNEGNAVLAGIATGFV